MKLWVLKNRRPILMIIAIYQFIGGLIGIWLIYSIASPGVNAGFVLAVIPIVALILCSLFAGIFYFFKGETTRFFLLSKINFIAQMIQFTVAGIKFTFYYGAYFTIGLNQDHILAFTMGYELVEFAMSFGTFDFYYLYINLVPLIPLAILRWCERNPAKDPLDDFLAEEEPVP